MDKLQVYELAANNPTAMQDALTQEDALAALTQGLTIYLLCPDSGRQIPAVMIAGNSCIKVGERSYLTRGGKWIGMQGALATKEATR